MTGPRLTALPGALSEEDRAWQDRADGLGNDTLRDVRIIAGRWSATIGALAGLFGLAALVFGPRSVDELSVVWRVAVGVLVLLVLVGAAAASWLAASAAQGRIVTTLRTAERYREAYWAEETRAQRQLRGSRLLTLVAGVLLIVAVGVSWYGPHEPRRMLVITTGPNTVQCVPLDDPAPVLVVGTGAALTVRDGCP